MTLTSQRAQIVRHTVSLVCRRLADTVRNARAWPTMSDDDLWYELAACILGSRVAYETVSAAVLSLRRSELLAPASLAGKRCYDRYERACARTLRQPLLTEGGAWVRYPYPALRANHLRRSVETVFVLHGSITDMIRSFPSVQEARAELAATLMGVGPKQASLFLRNIGYSDDVAVLDTHVMRYMGWMGIAARPTRYPRDLPEYEDTEAVFRDHARCMGYPVGHVDCAVWIVSRVAAKEMLV